MKRFSKTFSKNQVASTEFEDSKTDRSDTLGGQPPSLKKGQLKVQRTDSFKPQKVVQRTGTLPPLNHQPYQQVAHI